MYGRLLLVTTCLLAGRELDVILKLFYLRRRSTTTTKKSIKVHTYIISYNILRAILSRVGTVTICRSKCNEIRVR
jgi:hypothetical protein